MDSEPFVLHFNPEIAKGKPNSFASKIECPFCYKEKHINPKAILKEKENFLWVKNKFPIFEDTEQTVIIETNQCNEHLNTYSSEYAYQLFDFVFECRNEMLKTGNFKEVILLKNHGLESAGSISHAHMQLVGLKNISYEKEKIENSIVGPIVFSNKHVKVTISEVPQTEFYEFNVIWRKSCHSFEYVDWIQNIIRFLEVFKGGYFKSYNLAFHENADINIMKIYPRKVSTIYYLGFGIHQIPKDILKLASDLANFSKEFKSN